ncbi:MAG: sigma-70 family RNA polymerase sigma factor [Acidimicrobiales bacterium]
MQIYLNEIGHWPLLDRDDESRLGASVQQGIEAPRRLAAADVGSPAERAELLRRVEAGERSRTAFAEANLRLVVSIAKHYRRPGVELLDLVQAGNIGLMRAVERFDWRLGNRFSTYATWWIRQAIGREVGEGGRALRVPMHLREQVVAVACARDRLRVELGHEPSWEELAEETGLAPERVQELVALGESVVSLSRPVGDNEGGELDDFLADEAEVDPAEWAAGRSLEQGIRKLLSHVSEHQALVLRLRFGLDGGEPRSLQEVGRELGISRERVRQIEARALRRLRDDAAARSLREAS